MPPLKIAVRATRLSAALAAILLSAGHVQAQTCAPSDPAPVAQTLRDMYAAAMADSAPGMQASFAPDFYAFDGGRRLSAAELEALVKGLHAAGKIYVWTVQEPQVHLVCDTAWITYVNRGSVTDVGGTQALTWLESAVLRYDGGRWRIQFFHSTRVPAPAK